MNGIQRARRGLTGVLLSVAVMGFSATGAAAPPLGSGYSSHPPPRQAPPRPGERTLPEPTVTPNQQAPAPAEPETASSAMDEAAWAAMEGELQALRQSLALQRTNAAPLECPPDKPHNLDNTVCLTDAEWEIVQTSSGRWEIIVNPDGSRTFIPPPVYDPLAGEWRWDDASEPCNPNIDVVLKQAALAGSQITRKIADTQLGYPQTDPIHAVNNPRKEGYGGVCTIDIFVFDEIWKIIGSAYEQIKDLIEALKDFSMDDLFGAGCAIINEIVGDLQNQLLEDIESGLPLTQLEQLIRQLRKGFIAPLNTLTSLGLNLKPSQATLPGVLTTEPLLVTHIPDVGYVYFAQLSDSRLMVLHIAQNPLRPEDAVNPPAT